MQPVELSISARWILPVEPSGTVLEEHAVVVDDGRIVDILPVAEAGSRYAAARVEERPTHVLLPGLVNAHGHAAMTLLRGYADDLPLERWLDEHIRPAEERWVGEDFVADGTSLALLEMVRGGITLFGDMYYFPDVVARTAAAYGMRASIGMIVLEQPTVWASGADEYLRKGLELHDHYRGHPLVCTMFAPHSPYMVSDATFRQLRVLADELEVRVQMHVAETVVEVENSLREHGRRPLDRLDALGLVSPLLCAVHLTQTTDADIGLLAARGASVVHCPESNLKLASGFCPVPALAEAGVNLALGTDGAASNNDLDLFGEMRTAGLLARGISGRADVAAAADLLHMATLGGARALGLGDITGSLVPGKAADFICVDLAAPATQPVHNAMSSLVYAASRDQVTDVFVAGRQLLAGGRHLTADPADIFARAHDWQRRLREPRDG